MTFLLENIFTKFECCGFEGAEDWERHGTNQATGQFVLPDSCCRSLSDSFGGASPSDSADFSLDMVNDACGSERNPAFAFGCYESLNSWTSHNMGVVAGVALAVCLLQIFGTMFSCLLARSINLKHNGDGATSYAFDDEEDSGAEGQVNNVVVGLDRDEKRVARFRAHN
jgi:hypothetical protein